MGAFESTYDCLGITCNDVGGLILSGMDYYEGAETCGKVSKGSCYNAKGDHSVVCDVAEDDCAGSFFPATYVSARSGCCLCEAGCPMAKKDTCRYYDAKKDDAASAGPSPQPEPEPSPTPSPASPSPSPAETAATTTTAASGASSFCQFFIIAELWPNFAPNFCNSPKLRNQTFNMFLRQSNASFELFQI